MTGVSRGHFHDLQAEVEGRQVANALLGSHRKEAAAAERRLKEQYEVKLRDKQKQLNDVQDRLQVPSKTCYCCCTRAAVTAEEWTVFRTLLSLALRGWGGSTLP